MSTRFLQRLRPADLSQVFLAGGAALGVLTVVLLLLVTSDSASVRHPSEPAGFAVYPAGDDVPRLTAIKVTFAKAPAEKDAQKLLQVQPAVKGSFAWLSDRTVLFQPEFPGLLRGETYQVHVPARPETGLEAAVTREFTTTGKLVVTQAIPANDEAEVPLDAQVMVQFSRSVAPLTVLSAQRTAPVISIDPPLEGTGEWLNTSLYRFTPKALAPNTTYRLRIAAGLTSEADGVLEQDYSWSFTTVGPAVSSVTPDNNTKYASPTQPVTVVFNEPMDRASVEAGIRVTRGEGGAGVAGTFAWAEGSDSVTFTPSGRLEAAGLYFVSVAKGLRGANGGETKEERKTQFVVAGPPAISSTRPKNGETAAERWGINIQFANPMDMNSFEGRIAVSGFTVEQVEQATNAYDGLTLYISLPLKPSTSYTVNIAAGAKDRYGQPFPPYSFSFTTGQLDSSVSLAIPGMLGTYAASAEPILYFHATNVSEARFTLYPLTADEMNAFLGGKPIRTNPTTGQFQPSLPAIRSWTETVAAERNEVAIGSTSLSGGGNLPKGNYYVRTGGSRIQSELAFAVIDTELVTKLSQDELLVWAIDHDTGKPVSGINVHAVGVVVGPEGKTAPVSPNDLKTDARGLAIFKAPQPTGDQYYYQRAYVVTVDDGGRRGMTTTQFQQGASFYQLGLPVEYFLREYVGNIYTDRPIYRPGETVEYKAIIRADDDAQYNLPPADPGLDLVISDSQGKELVRKAVALNEFGTLAGSFALPSDAPIGDYSVRITGRDEMKRGPVGVAAISFLVAEFRKPEFEVAVATDQPAYANGDSMAATAKASFFFGGSLPNAPVEWSVLSSPFHMTVKGYERYSFSDYDYWRESVNKPPTRATGKATTGADGTTTFVVPAVLTGDEGAQQFQVSATVTDLSAQAVSASTVATVHPADLYAGVRPEQYVAQSGKESGINVVSVDTKGNILPSTPVTVLVYDRKWVTTKEQTPDGARRYRSEPKDTLVATLSTTTNAKGEGSVAYTPKNPGTLRIVAQVTDAKGRTARSAAYLWVAGEGFASWQISNDDILKLVADREQYNVGDTAEVLVPAPFEGATGLVTVERGKVISREVRQFPTNSERLAIPITDRSVPDVFVSVILYRPPTETDPVPRYKVGYVQLPVSTATRSLDISITPDRSQAKPGETVRYDIQVNDASGKGVKAELSAAVVDKALFTLEPDRTQPGLKAFWFERGLGVQTASSLAVSINRANDVISEPPKGGKGGGGLDDERLRQDFRNTAYWRAQLVTDANGHATVEVKMPDNLTTWRMDVRAVSGDTLVGEGSNELVSTQPLLLRPALPRFLRAGDSVSLRLLVRNATDKASDVKVALQAEGIDVSGDTTRSARIDPGQSAVMIWPANVSAEGTAKLTFSAVGSNGLKDAVVQQIPIWLDVTPESMATGGVVQQEPMAEALYLPPYAILKGGSLEVSVQPAIAGSLASELAGLAPMPFEYSEAVASRLLATVGVRRAEESAGRATSSLDARITADIAALVFQQKNGGGWGWCDRCPSDPNITGWALLALGEAARDGYKIDSISINAARSYVLAQINTTDDVLHPSDPNNKAFLLAALSSAGADVTAVPVARSLFEQYRAKLTNWGRAYLVLALNSGGADKSDAQVSQILNDLAAATIPSANGNHWEDSRAGQAFMTNTATTALVLNALTRVYPEHPLVNQTVRWLVVARGEQKWSTRIERAQAILALSTFSAQTGELAGNFAYNVTADGSDLLKGRFTPSSGNASDSKRVPLTDFRVGKVSILSFLRDFASPGRLYYTLNLRYLTPAKEVEAVSRGFAVSHQYTLLDDPATPVTSAKLGDTVRVTVTVMAPAERKYVVVDDLLPAGLEAVDTRLASVDPKLKAQLDADRRAAASSGQAPPYFAPWFRWYYNPFQHVDTRDDRITLLADHLPKGVYTYVYYARATTPGDFFVAPAHAEETYFPEVFGRSDSGRFTVTPGE